MELLRLRNHSNCNDKNAKSTLEKIQEQVNLRPTINTHTGIEVPKSPILRGYSAAVDFYRICLDHYDKQIPLNGSEVVQEMIEYIEDPLTGRPTFVTHFAEQIELDKENYQIGHFSLSYFDRNLKTWKQLIRVDHGDSIYRVCNTDVCKIYLQRLNHSGNISNSNVHP